MDWILQILATLGSALAVYVFLRQSIKKDVGMRLDKIEARLEKIEARLGKMERELQLLNTRISRNL